MLAGYLYDRKLMSESRLEESEERHRVLLENALDGINIVDREGNFVLVNPEYCRMLGYSQGELIGKSFLITIPVGGREEGMRLFKKAISERVELYTYEGKNVRKDGNIIHVQIKWNYVYRDGKVDGTMAIVRDITERKGAEEALKDSEEKYRLLVENTETGFVVVDDAGVVVEANEPYLRMVGVEHLNDIIGRSVLDWTAPECVEDNAAAVARCAEQGFVQDFETIYLREDGTRINILINATMQETSDGKRLNALCRDITERMEVEEARAFLANITKHATDAIVGLDLDTNVVSWNRGAEMLFGYSAREIIGKPWSLVVPKDAREACRKRFKKATFEGFVKTAETMRVAKGNKEFPAEMTITTLKDETGEHIGFVVITRDITERKEAEEEIRRYTQELERSNRLKDLFTDIMRHDLLNPVGVIKGFSEIVSMDMSPEEHRRIIERIRKSAEKLEAMIQSAATLAKVEAWEKLDFEERELCEILKGVVLDFKPLLKEKGMKVKFEGGRRCLARVNTSIEEVFANLLSNAIKYSPEKTKIIVGIEDVDKNWKIYVKDQGDGIPEEYKKAIFGRFKRGGKKGVKGTGLGLAIVKRIVELHKGRVWVEDNPGGGSIFYVQLPK